ncbi:zinc finger protein 808-like [Haliotis rubra]|uniref:zinc finger protein 808-like n=1 Tax=Haliotis rubra TaxID=36100 RepID=UPI001EE60328|nr:zinc finger protein 808-like [Haliotis rubra]
MYRPNAATCEVCGRRMATAFAMKAHLRIHTGERPFQCTQCDKTYLSNDALGHHKRSKHKKANTQGYQLKVCLSNIKRDDLNKQNKHPDNTWCNKGKQQHKTTKADSEKWELIGDEKHGTSEITQSVFVMDDHVFPTFKDTEKTLEFEHSEVNRRHGDEQINLNFLSDNVPQPSVDVTCKNNTGRHFEFESRDLNTQRCSNDNEEAIVGSATCEVCGRRMATAFALKAHLRIHTGERPFQCTQCDKTYLSNDALGHHKRSKHKKANTQGYQLKVCLSNIKRDDLNKQSKHLYNTWCNKGKQQHKTTKADSEKWELIGDEKHGTSEITQSVFMMDDHVVPTFKDTEKTLEFEHSEVNRRHGDEQINLNFVSDNVPQPSDDVTCKNNTGRHFEFESRDLNTQRCSNDNEEAIVGSAWECNRGSDNVPEQGVGMHKNSKQTLQNGKQILKKPYKSNSCQGSFAIKKGFEKHIMASDYETGGKKRAFECVVCDKVYVRRCTLTRHMRTHTAEKPSQCDVCEMRFYRRDYMLNHMKRVHKHGNDGNAVLSAHKFKVTKISPIQFEEKIITGD